MKNVKFVLLAFLLVAAQAAFAQNGKIRGTTYDRSNGEPMWGVQVFVVGTENGAAADFDGKFEFPRTLYIDDTLVFSYIGYGKKEYTITASETTALDITIRFDLSDIELMGEVMVDGTYKTKRNVFQKFIALFKSKNKINYLYCLLLSI